MWGEKRNVCSHLRHWRALLFMRISERVFLEKKKVFDYREGTKDMIELNLGWEWSDSEILELVAIVSVTL